ncbi:asparaginase [Aureimonas sp. AU40]|uniref:asparaginase n=1 Tax=Aureimonas sp. AU40 TaxID=1637747 RepID=UPI000781137C|nr:asparaginase [Aureimonas sp. AU40]
MRELAVEVTRGGLVESRHRVILSVVDAEGRDVIAAGDVDRFVFPRSAVKVFQAIPLIESGAADRFGLGDRELSLCCASHSGEAGHVALASDILSRAGLGESDLECGCHWPFDPAVSREMARGGAGPTQLHNNCSGKHAGFLCTAAHLGEDPKAYVGAEHPVQRRVREVMGDLTGLPAGDLPMGIDGCSIPTFAAPLRAFAAGFARLVDGTGLAPTRAEAGRRLIAACMAEPWMMSGTKRACARLMEAAPGRVFAKTGAEGVFCGAVPELGVGLALKAEDGTTRAAEATVAACLAQLFSDSDPTLSEVYGEQSLTALRNWEGIEVGEVRVVGLSAVA